MRVLTITSAYPSGPDDPRGIFIHHLAAALVARGIEVTVLAPAAWEAPLRETRDGVSVQRVNYWIPRLQRLTVGVGGIVPNLRRNPALIAQVPTLISALTRRAVKVGGAFDLIHAHWMFPAGLAGKAAARTHGIPLVVTSHGGDLNMSRHAWPLRALVRRISSAASACVGVSHAMVEEFVRQGIPPEKVCFIPLGVPSFKGSVTDRSALPRFFDKGIGLRIVYVGSLIPRKSVHTLLKAHGILERRGRVPGTLVIGSGPSESALRGLTATLGLTNVIFCGAQPPHVTTSWLRAADVLVLPSLSEGRGLVLLEAMEAGLPVIASDIPGPRELVIPNETGMLFPPGDAEALARCLERLFDDGALGSLLGAAGKELLQRERLTPDESARQHIALYESLGSGS